VVINLLLCFEDVWRGGLALLFMTSELHGGECSASGPVRLRPGENTQVPTERRFREPQGRSKSSYAKHFLSVPVIEPQYSSP
jgi:hypothetical protein